MRSHAKSNLPSHNETNKKTVTACRGYFSEKRPQVWSYENNKDTMGSKSKAIQNSPPV